MNQIPGTNALVEASGGSSEIAQRLPLGLYIAVLAWAPFPLGSNRAWAWSLLTMLVAVCWLVWGGVTWRTPQRNMLFVARYPIAATFAAAAMVWAAVQICPWAPASWAHPLWSYASQTLHQTVPATISLNPWRSLGELLKLLTYAAALWLTYLMTLRADAARMMLDAIIAIGAFYGFYAAVLKIFGLGQFELFYSANPVIDIYLSGPFVLHNSYATFAGLSSLAAATRLISKGSDHIVTSRGPRPWLLSCVQFLFGSGAKFVVAFLICFSTLLASASRAGALATICGMVVMLALVTASGRKVSTRRWTGVTWALALVSLLALTVLSGGTLASRLNDLVDAGGIDAIRLTLWDAARQMISDAPLLGLGLGTFQDAYPLYATHVLPLVMDKAHNDYLEFAAGLGLPAALAWWMAWVWLACACVRGVFVRRHCKHYPLLAVGASVLVAVHSAFDFSLQMPAVSLLYATLLGLGLAQSRSSRQKIVESRPFD